jgi:hypothetical protein
MLRCDTDQCTSPRIEAYKRKGALELFIWHVSLPSELLWVFPTRDAWLRNRYMLRAIRLKCAFAKRNTTNLSYRACKTEKQMRTRNDSSDICWRGTKQRHILMPIKQNTYTWSLRELCLCCAVFSPTIRLTLCLYRKQYTWTRPTNSYSLHTWPSSKPKTAVVPWESLETLECILPGNDSFSRELHS